MDTKVCTRAFALRLTPTHTPPEGQTRRVESLAPHGEFFALVEREQGSGGWEGSSEAILGSPGAVLPPVNIYILQRGSMHFARAAGGCVWDRA